MPQSEQAAPPYAFFADTALASIVSERHPEPRNLTKLICSALGPEYKRESVANDVAGSIRSGRFIEVLSQLISTHGAPRGLRPDNGRSFFSDTSALAANENLDIALIDPGKPWQIGTVESFNGKFRDECLSME